METLYSYLLPRNAKWVTSCDIRVGLHTSATVRKICNDTTDDEVEPVILCAIEKARQLYKSNSGDSVIRFVLSPDIQCPVSTKCRSDVSICGCTPRKLTNLRGQHVPITPHVRITIKENCNVAPYQIMETDLAFRQDVGTCCTMWREHHNGMVCQRLAPTEYVAIMDQLCIEISDMLPRTTANQYTNDEICRFGEVVKTFRAFMEVHPIDSLIIYVLTYCPPVADSRIHGILVGQQGTRNRTPWFCTAAIQNLSVFYNDSAWLHLLVRRYPDAPNGAGSRMLRHFCAQHPVVILEPFVRRDTPGCHTKNESMFRFYHQHGFVTCPTIFNEYDYHSGVWLVNRQQLNRGCL